MVETTQTPQGLQFERTELSWQRVALAFVANGSLLVGRHFFTSPNVLNLYAAATAFALAAVVAVMVHHRRLQLVRLATQKKVFAARAQVLGVALGSILLGMVVILMLLFNGA